MFQRQVRPFKRLQVNNASRILTSPLLDKSQKWNFSGPAAGEFSLLCKNVVEQLGNASGFGTGCYVIQNNTACASSPQRKQQPGVGLAHVLQLLQAAHWGTSGYKWN